MRTDYTFAERLSIEVNPAYSGTVTSIKSVINQLKEDYCFDVAYEGEDWCNFWVSFPNGYSDIKKDWVLEVIEYHKAAGVAIIVKERL